MNAEQLRKELGKMFTDYIMPTRAVRNFYEGAVYNRGCWVPVYGGNLRDVYNSARCVKRAG
jgi:hypothetical protein